MTMLPFKTAQRDQIIADVLKTHGIWSNDFFGKSRAPDLVVARMEAAQRLFDAGFKSAKAIGRILKRDRKTIVYYLSQDLRSKKKRQLRLSRFQWMPADLKAKVIDVADAKGISPVDLVHAWITERVMTEHGQLGGAVAA